jgi:uncharacterized protein
VKPLTIHVDDIHDSAQPWEAVMSREDLDEALLGDHPTEFHARGPATVKARLTRMGKKVLVQATSAVPLTGQCKRCLKDVELEESLELTLTYEPQSPSRAETARRKDKDDAVDEAAKKHGTRHDRDEEGAAGSFDLKLADEETYVGNTIDFAPAMREQIILALPPSPVCREECLGLCAICGQDKNLRVCGCVIENIDPRWAALKAVRPSQSSTNLKPSKE